MKEHNDNKSSIPENSLGSIIKSYEKSKELSIILINSLDQLIENKGLSEADAKRLISLRNLYAKSITNFELFFKGDDSIVCQNPKD